MALASLARIFCEARDGCGTKGTILMVRRADVVRYSWPVSDVKPPRLAERSLSPPVLTMRVDDTTHRHYGWFFACAQGVLFVVMMITILAAIPAEAQRAGSTASSRTHSTHAYAASRRTNATAQAEVQRLLRLMDKDKNGAVSKNEFMEYMSQTFDRLDVNRSDQLERNELRRMADPNWLLCHDLRMC